MYKLDVEDFLSKEAGRSDAANMSEVSKKLHRDEIKVRDFILFDLKTSVLTKCKNSNSKVIGVTHVEFYDSDLWAPPARGMILCSNGTRKTSYDATLALFHPKFKTMNTSYEDDCTEYVEAQSDAREAMQDALIAEVVQAFDDPSGKLFFDVTVLQETPHEEGRERGPVVVEWCVSIPTKRIKLGARFPPKN